MIHVCDKLDTPVPYHTILGTGGKSGRSLTIISDVIGNSRAVGESVETRRHLPWLQIVTRPLLFTYWQQSESWIQALLTRTHVLVLPLGLAVATAPRLGPG